MANSVRVLGIDTSLRSTGIAVVEAQGNRLRAVEYSAIRIPASEPLSECLRHLAEGLAGIIDRTTPQAAAVEGVFFSRNARTAALLGSARGVAIAGCALRGIDIYEYAPRRVKQAVVGFGGASKQQVRSMMMSMLALEDEPQEDAGDALAIAVCHLHSRSGHAALQPRTI